MLSTVDHPGGDEVLDHLHNATSSFSKRPFWSIWKARNQLALSISSSSHGRSRSIASSGLSLCTVTRKSLSCRCACRRSMDVSQQ